MNLLDGSSIRALLNKYKLTGPTTAYMSEWQLLLLRKSRDRSASNINCTFSAYMMRTWSLATRFVTIRVHRLPAPKVATHIVHCSTRFPAKRLFRQRSIGINVAQITWATTGKSNASQKRSTSASPELMEQTVPDAS